MKADFRLIGLSKSGCATLEPLDSDKEIFWAYLAMSEDRINAIFNWAKNENHFWDEAKIAEAECDYINSDGTSLPSRVINIRIWDLDFKPFH